MARLKEECISNNFCSGNVKQYLNQEFKMHITPGSRQCVFLNMVPWESPFCVILGDASDKPREERMFYKITYCRSSQCQCHGLFQSRRRLKRYDNQVLCTHGLNSASELGNVVKDISRHYWLYGMCVTWNHGVDVTFTDLMAALCTATM